MCWHLSSLVSGSPIPRSGIVSPRQSTPTIVQRLRSKESGIPASHKHAINSSMSYADSRYGLFQIPDSRVVDQGINEAKIPEAAQAVQVF